MNPIKMDANAIGKVISSYPRIEKAIVTIDKNQNGSGYEIIAYYITSGQPIELSELQHFLHDKLEPSCVPHKLCRVSQFPYNAKNEIMLDQLKNIPLVYDLQDIQKDDVVVVFLLQELTQLKNDVVSFDDLKKPFQAIGVNSLIFIDLIVSIEDHFDFTFPDDMLDLEMFHNFSELIQYIKTLIK